MSKCRALNGYHRVVPCRAGSAVTLEPAPPTQKQIPARQGICASLLVASTKKRLGRSADPARCISEAFLDGPLSTTQRTTSQKLSGPIHATLTGTVRLANQPPEQGPMPPANRKGARLGLGRARRERKWGGVRQARFLAAAAAGLGGLPSSPSCAPVRSGCSVSGLSRDRGLCGAAGAKRLAYRRPPQTPQTQTPQSACQ